MDNYVKTFKYSTADMIQCFSVSKDRLYTLTNTMLYGWNLETKALIIEKEHLIKANKSFLYQENLYFIGKEALYDINFKEITKLKFSTINLEIKQTLILIDEEEITLLEEKEGKFEFKSKKHNLNCGLCTAAVSFDDCLFISYENGKIFEAEVSSFFESFVKNTKFTFKEIIDIREVIVSMDKCSNKLAIGTTEQKLLTVKKKDYTYKFTKLTVEIKKVCCRNKEIFILDTKNNLLLFDDGLKIKGICSGVIDIDTRQNDIFIALEKKRILQLYDFSEYHSEQSSRVAI